MIAEIISIGDELTTGQRLDTNSQWLSQRLCEFGVRTAFHTTVADDLAANVSVFEIAADRADIVVATGGLGPTADDLTREALAAMAGVELVQNDEQLRIIEGMFARRGRSMPERNRVQALFPAGSLPIPNPNGTAPGVALAMPREGRSPCRIYCLPGVPAEMFAMWEATVAPAIIAAMPARRVIRHRRIKCYGVGESHLEAMLPDLIRRGREPSVGITVSKATITLRITAAGESDLDCAAAIEPTAALIRETLGTIVFGEEEEDLADVVAALLDGRRESLAVVEWGTEGIVAQHLTAAASDRYPTAALALHDAAAADRLFPIRDEPSIAELAAADSAASREVAAALAVRCRERFETDLAVATSAIGGATGDAPPVFHVAIATRSDLATRQLVYAGNPDILRDKAAKDTLNFLRLWLMGDKAVHF